MRVGIFGATGMVGREILTVLYKRNFPVEKLQVYASKHSAGKTLETPLGSYTIQDANNADYSELDVAFYAIGGGWPKEHAPKAIAAGCYVIDNSSTFRMDSNVPLIIPEINPQAIGESKLIANPNCTTAIAAIPLWHIHKTYGLKKVIAATYQATSGAGNGGMDELKTSTRAVLDGKKPEHSVFQYPIAFNTIPHIDTFQDNGYTREEMKLVHETRKIFGDASLPISSTSVRIPTLRAHSIALTVETAKPVSADAVREELGSLEGIVVKDSQKDNIYPMPQTASEQFDVEVGRIRQSLIFENYGLDLFVCGDQVLRGAGLNAVLIAELLLVKQKKQA